jgi:hypothetical protein
MMVMVGRRSWCCNGGAQDFRGCVGKRSGVACPIISASWEKAAYDSCGIGGNIALAGEQHRERWTRQGRRTSQAKDEHVREYEGAEEEVWTQRTASP